MRPIALAALAWTTACAQPPVLDTGASSPQASAPKIPLDGALRGELAYGHRIDLAWADSPGVDCWPRGEDPNFAGSHVFYTAELPADTLVLATVTPEPGVDANVYLVAVSAGSDTLPPEVDAALGCAAGFPLLTDSNPGDPDQAVLPGLGRPARLIVAVAGARGHTAGGYTLITETAAD